MRETKCELIRRELDELMLGDDFSVTTMQHLRDCGECRQFQEQQTRLRQIVGSLHTVQAPADFDFRLRARLANESTSAGFQLRGFQWSFATKGFAAAALLVVFVGGAVYVRNVIDQPATMPVAVQTNEPVQPARRPDENNIVAPAPAPTVAVDNGPRKQRTAERQTAQRPRRAPVAVDSAMERAPVFSNAQRQSAIFPIDASLQSFTVSLDDGNGNARTISMPTISFGSQRVLTNTYQFAPKGVW